MSNNKPMASLSLDLDNLWSYMKTHGDLEWESLPSYLDIVVPRVIEFLKKRELKITFFIVGLDVAKEDNHSVIRLISEAGHEIGNHSFNHEPWLHLYTEEQIEIEISKTESYIEKVTGQRPIGFRGPGYSLSETVLQVLLKRGYQYDASTLPTFIGPVARAYYFMTTRLTLEEKKSRRILFGEIKDGLRSVHPYRWDLGSKKNISSLLEIPVTTLPFFKIPFHVSYIIYINRFSPMLARLYFRLAMKLCRLAKVSPSLLLHPLDFLGYDDVDRLSFFPGMDIISEQKIELVSDILKIYTEYFNVVPMWQHAKSLLQRKDLLSVKPNFNELDINLENSKSVS